MDPKTPKPKLSTGPTRGGSTSGARSFAAIVGIVAFLGAMIWLGYAIIAGPAMPDPETSDAETVQKFIASDKFKRMSLEERAEYTRRYDEARREKMRDVPREERRNMFRSENSTLTDQERRQMRENMGEVREQQMLAEAKAFFALSEAEQEAYWDKRVEEMEARRKEWQDRRAEAEKSGEARPRPDGETKGPGEGGGPPRGEGGRGFGGRRPNADQMVKRGQERLSESTPEDRAIMSEYFRRMREAMEKRGVQGRGFMGGGRRGG